MSADTGLKQQIHQIIETLAVDKLPELLRFLNSLLRKEPDNRPETPVPIYQAHQHAVETGISDLAAQHDHYLYGVGQEDNV